MICGDRGWNGVGHSYIGTEHLLLGMLRESEGVAAKVFNALQVDPSKVRSQVRRALWLACFECYAGDSYGGRESGDSWCGCGWWIEWC